MKFDPCEHQVRMIVLKAGIALRKAMGLPEESNLTRLHEWVSPLLGIEFKSFVTSVQGNQLPIPSEVRTPDNRYVLPRKDCPKCGEKESVILTQVCANCEDGKAGWKTSWVCTKNCGYKDLSKRSMGSWLDELAPDWESGSKADMGIKTSTDEGLK